MRKASRSTSAEGLEFETALANDARERRSRGAVHVFFAERDCRRVPGIGEEISATPVKSAVSSARAPWAAASPSVSPMPAVP